MVRSPEHHITRELPAPATSLVLAAEVAKIVQQAERAHSNFLTELVIKPGIKRKNDRGLEPLLNQVAALDQELVMAEPSEDTVIALSRLLSDLHYLYSHESKQIRHTTNVDQIYEAISASLMKHLDRIQAVTGSDQPGLQKRAFRILSTLLEIEQIRSSEASQPGTTENARLIFESIKAEIPHYVADINAALADTDSSAERLAVYTPLFEIALEYLPPTEREQLDQPLAELFFKAPNYQLSWIVAKYTAERSALYSDDLETLTVEERQELRPLKLILEGVGYSAVEAKHLVECWLSGAPLDDQVDFLSSHLTAMQLLETKQGGVSHQLSKDFGIRCFGRYKPETLIQQQLERDAAGDYGIYCNAIMDHNGSARSSQTDIDKISTQLKPQDGRLRIIEAGTKVDLFKRLIRLKTRHQQPSQFLFIHAHADKDTLVLGRSKWQHANVESDDITTRLGESVDKLLSPTGQIVMIGCEAGQANGIAEKTSREFKRQVTASKYFTHGVKKLTARYLPDKRNYTFDVVFHTSKKTTAHSEPTGSTTATTYGQ